MLRTRLCQRLPFKLETFRPFYLSASASNRVHTVNFAPSSQHGLEYSEPVHQLFAEPHDSLCGEKLSACSNTGFHVQSITPFPFDDVATQESQDSTTRVHVLDQWRHLLDSLKTIVDSFHSAQTTIQEVTAVRQVLERHHLVKFLLKPFSYTADVVIDVGEPRNSYHPHTNQVDDFLPKIDFSDVGKAGLEEYESLGSAKCRLHAQSSLISRLEQESLRAASVLSSGAWKAARARPESASTRCDAFDLTWSDCTASALFGAANLRPCRAKENRENGDRDPNSRDRDRPNRDQLSAVQDHMAENLPKLFVKFHSYDIYTNDVIFENNWYLGQSYATAGVTAYALEIAKLRLFVHLRYANVRMQLLKTTTNDAEGAVQVRWRIMGIPQVKAVMFWKFLPWSDRSSTAVDSEWLDGFSTFFVNGSGLIYKHRMDRVIPDEGPELKNGSTVLEKIASSMASPVAAAAAAAATYD